MMTWKNQFAQHHSFDWSRADSASQATHVQSGRELAQQCCFLRFDCNLESVSK